MSPTMSRVLTLAAAVTLLLTAAVALASVSGPYTGRSSAGRMSFSLSKDGRYVTNFRFVNACPTDSVKGNLVPGRMRIDAKGRFHHYDEQFKVIGRFTSSGAQGVARNDTGDCHSGVLHWTARPLHD